MAGRSSRNLQAARLDLGKIQNVVDELEQMTSTGVDVADVALLAFAQLAVALVSEEVRKAHDGVQRSTQLMAHGGQEAILEFAGALGVLLGAY
jgi:hypothetical protein